MTPVNFISQVHLKYISQLHAFNELLLGRWPHGPVPWIQLPLFDRAGLLVHIQDGQEWNLPRD